MLVKQEGDSVLRHSADVAQVVHHLIHDGSSIMFSREIKTNVRKKSKGIHKESSVF